MKAAHVIYCGGAPSSKKQSSDLELELDPRSRRRNIDLKLTDISKKLVKNIPPLLVDLVELATYVYCADQMVSRGGDRGQGVGSNWRRELKLVIPVRCPDKWSSMAATTALRETLGFLSDDEYSFKFLQHRNPVPVTEYLDSGEDNGFSAKVHDVLLFSGGLDSLAGVVRESVGSDSPIALVSHRSTPKVVQFRQDLIDEVSKFANTIRPYHIPVWSHKRGLRSRENTQRSRTFLYSALAATVARRYGLNRILFYENGITSLNLPISEQLVGSRASRSTHPEALRLISRFLSELFGMPFSVENPAFGFTKADMVDQIIKAGAGRLIAHTRSCHHTQDTTTLHTHCGKCSQCVSRRLAILAGGHERYDPLEMYKSDPVLSPSRDGPERVIAESYPRVAREIGEMDNEVFFGSYGEATSALSSMGGRVDEAARRVFDLSQRHSTQVRSAITHAIEKCAGQISRGEVPPSSLLGMIIGQNLPIERSAQEPEAAAEVTEKEYFYPSRDFMTLQFRGQNLHARPRAAQLLQVMHQEYFLTRVDTVSDAVLHSATDLQGDLFSHLRHSKDIWNVIVGSAGKGLVKFLVLPAPESRGLAFPDD